MGGVLVAGVGLPGVGKSTVFAALADYLIRNSRTASLYREPEETVWPDAVTYRDRCGYITAMTWFRSIRVPMLYHADRDRADGNIAIIDSYYDKLIHLYFEDPSFAWLIPVLDPYRSIYKQIAQLDFETLPDADCVVTFTVSKDRWKELVLGRGRELDRKSSILEQYPMQQAFLAASKQYCEAKGIPNLIFENSFSTPASAANALSVELTRIGILPSDAR